MFLITSSGGPSAPGVAAISLKEMCTLNVTVTPEQHR